MEDIQSINTPINADKTVSEELKFKPKITIAQLSVGIIILGLVKQILYYEAFNLPIKYFLSLSELGLVLSEDLLTFVPLLIMLIISGLLGGLVGGRRFRNIHYNEQEPFKLIGIPRKIKTIIFIACGILVIVTFVCFFLQIQYYKKIDLLSYSIMAFGISLILIFDPYIYKLENFKWLFLIFLSTTILSYIFGTLGNEIKVVHNGKYKGTIVTTNDSVYTSTNNSYFIGKTEKYIFIYNRKELNTIVIPTDLVTKLLIKSK